MEKTLNLVQDNKSNLMKWFVEELEYSLGYYEDKFKPLLFGYMVSFEENCYIRIQVSLTGKQNKLQVVKFVDFLSSPKYNLHIVQLHLKEIKLDLESKVFQLGIKSFN